MLKSASVLFLLGSFSVLGSKPACSRFHYEEQTLEKMIRQEIFVEKMKDDVESLRKVVSEAVQNAEECKTEIAKLKASTNVVAFMAHELSDKSVVDGKIVIFSKTLLNTGNGYNKATGVFVAPVEGVYQFAAQICLGVGTRSYYAFYLNDSKFSKALFGDKDYETCYSLSAVMTLKTGDEVTVKCTTYCNGKSLWENNIASNSFSGVLVA